MRTNKLIEIIVIAVLPMYVIFYTGVMARAIRWMFECEFDTAKGWAVAIAIIGLIGSTIYLSAQDNGGR